MKAVTLYDPQVHLAHSKTTKTLMALGQKQSWAFAVLGIAPMPQEPISLSKWRIVPAHLDTSPMPQHAMERIQTIYAEGIRPQGFVVVHELPMQLPASVPDVIDGEVVVRPGYDFTIDIDKALGVGLKAVGAIAIAAVTAAGIVLPAIFAVGSALLLDPILIAVADGVWIEVDRWVE